MYASETIAVICENHRKIAQNASKIILTLHCVQSLSHVKLCDWWTEVRQASLSFTVSWSLLKFMSIELVMLSNRLLCPTSPPALNLSQHQGLFQWFDSLHQANKVLKLQLQHQSFQWVFRVDFLWDRLVWSPWSPRDSQESSPAPQFETIKFLMLSLL